jgi:hypothetical protein
VTPSAATAEAEPYTKQQQGVAAAGRPPRLRAHRKISLLMYGSVPSIRRQKAWLKRLTTPPPASTAVPVNSTTCPYPAAQRAARGGEATRCGSPHPRLRLTHALSTAARTDRDCIPRCPRERRFGCAAQHGGDLCEALTSDGLDSDLRRLAVEEQRAAPSRQRGGVSERVRRGCVRVPDGDEVSGTDKGAQKTEPPLLLPLSCQRPGRRAGARNRQQSTQSARRPLVIVL